MVGIIRGIIKGLVSRAFSLRATEPVADELKLTDPLEEAYYEGKEDGESDRHSHLFVYRPEIPEHERKRATEYLRGYRDGYLRRAYERGRQDGRSGQLDNPYYGWRLVDEQHVASREKAVECAEAYSQGFQKGLEESRDEQLHLFPRPH